MRPYSLRVSRKLPKEARNRAHFATEQMVCNLYVNLRPIFLVVARDGARARRERVTF